MRRFITLAAMISIMSGLGLTMVVLDAMERGQWPVAEAPKGQISVRLDLASIPLAQGPSAPPDAPVFGRETPVTGLGGRIALGRDAVIAGDVLRAEPAAAAAQGIEPVAIKRETAPAPAAPVAPATPAIAVTKVRLGDLRDRGLLVIDVEGEPAFQHRLEENNRTLVVALEGARADFDAGAVNNSRLVELFQAQDTPDGLELRLASIGQLEVIGAAYLPASASRGPRLAVEFQGDGTTAEGEPMPDNQAIRLYQDLDGRAVFVADEKETVIGSNSL